MMINLLPLVLPQHIRGRHQALLGREEARGPQQGKGKHSYTIRYSIHLSNIAHKINLKPKFTIIPNIM